MWFRQFPVIFQGIFTSLQDMSPRKRRLGEVVPTSKFLVDFSVLRLSLGSVSRLYVVTAVLYQIYKFQSVLIK